MQSLAAPVALAFRPKGFESSRNRLNKIDLKLVVENESIKLG